MAKIEKVLFIDDDPICTFLNISLVEELEIAKEVKALDNAPDALKYILENYSTQPTHPTSPDLVFLDIKLPGVDGFDMLKELEKMNDIARSRFLIVILTASIHPSDKEKAAYFSSGVFAYLTKPLTEDDLKKLLADRQALVAN